jgi:hypothetical protein
MALTQTQRKYASARLDSIASEKRLAVSHTFYAKPENKSISSNQYPEYPTWTEVAKELGGLPTKVTLIPGYKDILARFGIQGSYSDLQKLAMPTNTEEIKAAELHNRSIVVRYESEVNIKLILINKAVTVAKDSLMLGGEQDALDALVAFQGLVF